MFVLLRVVALAFALMGACGHAKSEPIQLACTGKKAAAFSQVTEDYTIAVKVDLLAKTVTVGSYGTVPIVGGTDEDTLVFMRGKTLGSQVSMGALNRITGVTSVQMIFTLTDGVYRFYGTCKPAQRLFSF